MIYAGLEGIRGKTVLAEPISGNPANMEKKPQRLPTTLMETGNALRSNSLLHLKLGGGLIYAHLKVMKTKHNAATVAWHHFIYSH